MFCDVRPNLRTPQDDERLRVLARKRLRTLTRAELAQPVRDFAESPRRDRLIEQSLPVRDVTKKLLRDSEPLLVVGESGVTHIINVADFAGAAGTAVALAFLVAVDSALNELLLRHRDEAVAALTDAQRADAEDRRATAEREGAALDLIDYLTMGVRLTVMRKLHLNEKYDLGFRDEHELLRRVRNEAAHGSLADPARGLRAMMPLNGCWSI
jgi:hypothetical protein